jgi:hypothetical protein
VLRWANRRHQPPPGTPWFISARPGGVLDYSSTPEADCLVGTVAERLQAMKAARMQDHLSSPEAAGWLAPILYKFLPGALGAFVMVMVDVPQTRRDLFIRLFVAFVASVVLGDVVFDLLHSFAWLAFLDDHKQSHVAAVNFLTGGFGWFVIGGGVMLAKRWRDNPTIPGIEQKAQ